MRRTAAKQRRFHVQYGLCFVLLAAGSCTLTAAADFSPSVSFGERGLASIGLRGADILSPRSTPTLRDVLLRKADDTTELPDRTAKAKKIFFPGNAKLATTTFDRQTRKLRLQYAWGDINIGYREHDGRLDADVTVTNRSADILSELNFEILRLRLPVDAKLPPVGEAVYFGQTAPIERQNSLSGPLVLPLTAPDYTLVACSPEAVKPLTLAWERAADKEKLAQWTLLLHVGGDRLLYDEVYDTRPIPPGSTDSFSVSLRFGAVGDALAPAADICAAYAKAHPLLVNWPDRRPIVRTFIGDSFSAENGNAIPWKTLMGDQPAMSVAPAVKAEFRKMVMASAESDIEAAKQANAQGIIVWNVEGNGLPARWLQYVGDPHMIETLAPAMNECADDYFRKFKAAGLRIGICLRPTVVRKGRDANNGKPTILQDEDFSRSVVDILSEKVQYAKRRWGCTLFYVDSDGRNMPVPNDPKKTVWALMSADEWEELARRNPDSLFIPEHSYLRCYASSAAYDQMDMWAGITPPLAKSTWPGAFKCLVLDYPSVRQYDKMVAAFRNGDILMSNLPLEMNGGYVRAAGCEAAYLEAGEPAAIAQLGLERCVAIALDRKTDAGVRFYTSRRLAQSADTRAYDALAKLAMDSDWLVAKNGVLGLGHFHDLRTVNTLIGLLIDPRPGKEPMVLQAFTRMGKPAIATLTPMAQANTPWGQAAVKALGAVNGPESQEALVDIVRNRRIPAEHRQLALETLSQRKDPPITELLISLLPDPGIRMAVVRHLQNNHTPRVLAAFRAALAAEEQQPSPDKEFMNALTAVISPKNGK